MWTPHAYEWNKRAWGSVGDGQNDYGVYLFALYNCHLFKRKQLHISGSHKKLTHKKLE